MNSLKSFTIDWILFASEIFTFGMCKSFKICLPTGFNKINTTELQFCQCWFFLIDHLSIFPTRYLQCTNLYSAERC